MKNFNHSILATIALSILLVTGCEKEGPVGPAGASGSQGIQGPQGATGNQGQSGTNLIVKTFTLYPSDFTEFGTQGEPLHRYSATKNISEITQSVYDNGMVIVYYQGSGTTPPPWYSLPQTLYKNGYSYTLTYSHYVGGVGIQRYDSDLNSIQPEFNLTLKVVIVPPLSGKKEWDVDFNDYNAVKSYFNLKD